MQPDRCARFAQYGVPQGRGREHFDFRPKAEDLTWRLGFFKRQRCEEPAVARINARRFINDECNRRGDGLFDGEQRVLRHFGLLLARAQRAAPRKESARKQAGKSPSPRK